MSHSASETLCISPQAEHQHTVSRLSFTPRTLPGWADEDTVLAAEAARRAVPSGTVLSCRPAGRAVAGAGEDTCIREYPRLLIAGSAEGTFVILVEHLKNKGDWEIICAPSLEEAESLLESITPDVLIALWTDRSEMKTRVTGIRHHAAGGHLPIILIGMPPEENGTSPYQPVRGVLCLPRPLKWRTLMLCLDEHLRALRRRSGLV